MCFVGCVSEEQGMVNGDSKVSAVDACLDVMMLLLILGLGCREVWGGDDW